MPSVKAIATDLLNGFPVSDLPLLFMHLFAALLLAYLILRVSGGLQQISRLMLVLVVLVTLVVVLCRNSVQLSLLFAAAGLLSAGLVTKLADTKKDALVLFSVIFTALACGTGYVIPAGLVIVVFVLPLLWWNRKSE